MVKVHDNTLMNQLVRDSNAVFVFNVAKETQKLQSLNYACHSQDVHFRWSDNHPSSPEADGGGCPSPAVFSVLLLEDPPESGQTEAISVGNAGQVDVGGSERRLEASNPEESRCVSWSAHSLYSRTHCAVGLVSFDELWSDLCLGKV
jgi:hypothetical protein